MEALLRTTMISGEWKLPLYVAMGMHLVVMLGGLYLPGLFKAKPKYAEIYTVSIVNIAEQPEVLAQPQAESPPENIASEVKAKKIAPIAEAPAPQQPAPAAKKISLVPVKKKKKNKIVKEKKSTQQVKTRRQELAKALREEQLLNEKARLAREALERERQLLDSTPVAANKMSSESKVAKTGSTGGNNAAAKTLLEGRYHAAVANRILQFWALPENLARQTELVATAIVTVNKDGSIADLFFESKSGNRLYDQFVLQSITAADPLPPIPAALKKQRFEFGLVFRPGSIQ